MEISKYLSHRICIGWRVIHSEVCLGGRTSLVSAVPCQSQVQEPACPWETCPPTSQCGPLNAHREPKCSPAAISTSLVTADERGSLLPVRCRVCPGWAGVWSPRVRGRAYSPPWGSPPSGSAPSAPSAPPSASSDLEHPHKHNANCLCRTIRTFASSC